MSATGFPAGVCADGSKFRARIKVGGLDVHLGTFDTVDEASAVYKRAAMDKAAGREVTVGLHL